MVIRCRNLPHKNTSLQLHFFHPSTKHAVYQLQTSSHNLLGEIGLLFSTFAYKMFDFNIEILLDFQKKRLHFEYSYHVKNHDHIQLIKRSNEIDTFIQYKNNLITIK